MKLLAWRRRFIVHCLNRILGSVGLLLALNGVADDIEWRERLTSAFDAIDGELKLRYYGHFDELGADHLRGRADATLRLEMNGELGDNVSYRVLPVIHANNYTGSTNYLDRIWEKSEERYTVNLDEAYVTFSGESYDVRVGKQVYAWGYADAVNPTDNINPADFVDIGQIEKIGVPSLYYTYAAEQFNFDAVVVPVFTPSRLPPPDSRWAGDLSEAEQAFSPFTLQLGRTIIPHRTLDNVQFAGKLSSSALIDGWDLALSYYQGHQSIGVFRGSIVGGAVVLDRVFPKVREIGAGFSTTAGQFEIHGEAAYHDTRDNDMDDDYYEYTVGFNYTMDGPPFEFMERVTFIAEYVHEDIRRRKPTGNEFSGTGEYIRPFLDAVVGKVMVKFSEETRFETAFIQNLPDEDYLLRPELEHKFNDDTKIAVGAEIFAGSPDTFFGKWDRNDRVYAILTRYF